MSNGNFAGGDGTASNPYLIEDAADLNAVRNNLTKAYKLIKDIDLNISPYNTGTGWNPIGNNSVPFKNGVFDGDGHIISNLFINKPSINNTGLFGYLNTSTIKNVGLKNVNITAGALTGGLVGYSYSSHILNCYSTGVIISNGNNTGGLAGLIYYNSSISNSYSLCNITGAKSVGGLVEDNDYKSSISNSYSTGIVNGSSNVGGLVGENHGSIAHCYWDTETSGISTSAGGTGLTTAQMETPSSFVGWDTEVLEDGVTKVWILKDGEYPKLWFEKASSKFLIKDNNSILYTYNDSNIIQSPSQTIDMDNFNSNGFNDPTLISEEIWNNAFPDKTGLQLLMYTDDTTKTKTTIEYNVDEYRAIDKLDNQFQIKKYIPS